MSEENTSPSVSELNLDELKKLYAVYSFIHQVLVQSTRYSIEEFAVAQESIKIITSTANNLSDKIQALTPLKVESSVEA